MQDTNPHDWVSSSGHYRRYVCGKCGMIRHDDSTPGWPSWSTYYDSNGNGLPHTEEPPCERWQQLSLPNVN